MPCVTHRGGKSRHSPSESHNPSLDKTRAPLSCDTLHLTSPRTASHGVHTITTDFKLAHLPVSSASTPGQGLGTGRPGSWVETLSQGQVCSEGRGRERKGSLPGTRCSGKQKLGSFTNCISPSVWSTRAVTGQSTNKELVVTCHVT